MSGCWEEFIQLMGFEENEIKWLRLNKSITEDTEAWQNYNIPNSIPLFDFTKEWNGAKLCKEFGISEELWQYINNFIPDYYEDYKSRF